MDVGHSMLRTLSTDDPRPTNNVRNGITILDIIDYRGNTISVHCVQKHSVGARWHSIDLAIS